MASIPAAMHYKPAPNSGSSFLHYGDPGADQGDRHDIHYSYLLWSFLDAHGGGHVRALLAPGQRVQPCDVDPILMNAWDNAGNVNGTVLARYVRTQVGRTPLYGWMVWEHQSGDDPVVEHQALVSGLPGPMPPSPPVSPPVTNPVPQDHGPNPATASATAATAAPPVSNPVPADHGPNPTTETVAAAVLPPPPPVAMKAALQLARKATLDAHGRLAVPIACTGTAASACTGTVRLDAVVPAARRGARRWSKLARTRYAVPPGGAAYVTLRVRAALRARLPHRHAVRARVLLDGAPQALTLVRR